MATILLSSLLLFRKDILLAFRAGIPNRIDPEPGERMAAEKSMFLFHVCRTLIGEVAALPPSESTTVAYPSDAR